MNERNGYKQCRKHLLEVTDMHARNFARSMCKLESFVQECCLQLQIGALKVLMSELNNILKEVKICCQICSEVQMSSAVVKRHRG